MLEKKLQKVQERRFGNPGASRKPIYHVGGKASLRIQYNVLTCVFFFAGGSSPLTLTGLGTGTTTGLGVILGRWMNSGCGGGGRADRKFEADDPVRVVPSRYRVSSRWRRPPPAPCLVSPSLVYVSE